MAVAPGKKECLGCFELIHEKAQKCPHCQQIQSKLYTTQYNKWVMVPLVVLLFGFMLYLLNDVRRIGHRNSADPILAVESAKLYARNASGRDFVSCSGIIANTSSTFDATYIDLRADFYDSNDELIDTVTDDSNLKILRGLKTPYRVRSEADKPLSDYASCRVTTVD